MKNESCNNYYNQHPIIPPSGPTHPNQNKLYMHQKYYEMNLYNEYMHRRKSATTLTVIGLLLLLADYIVTILFAIYGNHTRLYTNAESYNISVPIVFIFIFLVIITTLMFVGIPFGIRSVFRVLRGMPVVLVVFSVLFFAIVIALILEIAYLIGWIIMIKEWIYIKRTKNYFKRIAASPM